MEDLENIEINGNVTVSKNELFFGAIDAAINSPNSVTYRFKGDVVVKKGTFDNNLPSSSNGIFIFDGGVEFQGDRWGSSFFKSKISKLIFNCEGKKISINDSFMGQTEYVEIVFNGTPSSDSTISADAFKKGGNKDITIAVSDLNKWTNAGFPTIFEDGVNPDITVTEIA